VKKKKLLYWSIVKKLFILLLCLQISSTSYADVKGQALSNISERISEKVLSVIPGEGVTEFDIQFSDQDDNDPRFNLLLLRDINKKENSNLFTQFSLHTQDVGQENLRYIGNIGLGYRFLNEDKSFMFGTNVFYDRDLEEDHERGSFGLEAKAGILEFNLNLYQKISNQKIANNRKEQSLGGRDYIISSQVPYLPWAQFNFTGYEHEKDIATEDAEGRKYGLELSITPSLIFEAEYDESRNNGGDDVSNAKIIFVYPPRSKRSSMQDELVSNEAFYKKDMSTALEDKVRRNNNIAIETQGAVIITKK